MYKKLLLCVTATLACSQVFADSWVFRGTPNAWGQTPMTVVSATLVTTCQNFVSGDANGGPRFKIDNITKGSWVEAYPSSDFVVNANTSYDITFNPSTHAVNATPRTTACGTSSSSSSVSSSSKSSSISSSSKSSSSSTSSVTSSSASSAERWLFRGTPNNWDTNTPMVKSGNLFVTCQNFLANDPRFKISNGNKLTPTTWVEAYPASDLRVAANTSFDITFNSSTHAITTTARTTPCGIDENRSLFIHDQATLNVSDANGSLFNLKRILSQFAAQLNVKNPTKPTSAGELFARMWDSQNTPANQVFIDGPKCTGTLNGFPTECRFSEGDQARNAEAAMATYIPIALVNRFDLHDSLFKTCGEYRIIFARNDGRRNFIILEAQLANPSPGNTQLCLPIVSFWRNLTNVSDSTARGKMLADFYYNGLPASGNFPSVAPVFNIDNYSATGGQIRTNEFMGGISWVLKEFKIGVDSSSGLSLIMPVSDKANPFGPLFNDVARTDTLASDFRSQFLKNINSLLISDLSTFSLTVENDLHNNGQSHSNGDTTENQFLNNSNQGSGVFKAAIQTRLTQLGSNLTVDQVLNRATAMTCAGCHQPTEFNLTFGIGVGPNQVWPQSLGFTHVNETPFNGVFNISPALQDVFLPSRKAGMELFLKSFNAGSAAAGSVVPASTETTVLTGKRSG